jgi:hypothetical protein
MALPLDLFIEVTTAEGTRYRWDANQAPGSRPLNLSFRSKIGEGFSDASLQLARRIDLDYPDLNLGDAVTIRGADGGTVYEGYVAAMPRELSDRHVIGVTLTGWMAHAKDRQFQEIYVDRDIGQWGDMPLERKAGLGPISYGDFGYTTAQGGLVCALPNQALGTDTIAEAWYQAPPDCTVAKIGYKGTTTSLPGGWLQTFYTASGRDDLRGGGGRTHARRHSAQRHDHRAAVRHSRDIQPRNGCHTGGRRESHVLQARRLRQPRPHDPHRRHHRT